MLRDRSAFLEGEPGLSVLYKDESAKMAGTAELLGSMDKGGVEKAMVTGFSFRKEDNARRYNEWLLKECSLYPDRLYPLASFDPRAPFAPSLSEEFLDSGGFGLGELCVYDEGLTPALTDRLLELCALASARGRPVLVHVNEPVGRQYPGKAPIETSQIYNFIRRAKGAKLILAHFGGGIPFFASLRKEAREELSRVRFDTAAMPFIFDPLALACGVRILGASSFLFGTDYPLLRPERYYKYFADAGLSPEETDAILGKSAAEFLGL
jgi:predicted TIM-barrel fold metal-dependent hydrolase